ncbi:hypothetical protein L6164_028944 [Bauhinia variegata]|uniref:Uncharacterized protein n=1 Tax=Bauhinia variegata TaxID=167791 RepID=A0ACB9L8F0_BAUVA|nr:hypothetical protein L6164_028944 [Bauhinia variegata]
MLLSGFLSLFAVENMAEEETKPLNYISEVVLKKRKSNEARALGTKEQFELANFKSNKSNDYAKKLEDFIIEYRSRELDLIRMKLRSKRKRSALLTPKSKKNGMHPKTRKVLYSLGLRRILSVVLVKATEGILEKLERVEPYVTNEGTNIAIKLNAIFLTIDGKGCFIHQPCKGANLQKGTCKNIDKQKVPPTDNNLIEQVLGKLGIACLEDMVHEIANVGPHFKEIVRFLWPFQLNKPTEG